MPPQWWGMLPGMVNVNDLIDTFEDMTLLELSDFLTQFEETFDVTGTPITAPPISTLTVMEEVEEQTEFDVILEAAGAKKIGVIKAVRELGIGLGLKEAKDLVDAAPKQVLGMVTKEAADTAADKLRAAGATVTIK